MASSNWTSNERRSAICHFSWSGRPHRRLVHNGRCHRFGVCSGLSKYSGQTLSILTAGIPCSAPPEHGNILFEDPC